VGARHVDRRQLRVDMSPPHGRPKEGSLPLGGKARSAKGAPVSSEFHVAGIVVYAVPAELERVAREITTLSGAQVHASNAVGKLVVTLEARAAREVLSRFDDVKRVRGVLTAALVYQHGDREVDDGAPGGHEESTSERFA
jgi:nitrate reductase NapD